MDMELKNRFADLWNRYFNGSDLPITFFYSNDESDATRVSPPKGHQCIIGVLSRVFKGRSLCFDSEAIGCAGARRYLGFNKDIMPDFEYFLSCGIAGKLEGERYKKTPEMVNEVMTRIPFCEAPARYIVFKRWDMLDENDPPEVVIFFARPDVLSGLFTIAGFDETDLNAVMAPFGAGCAGIVHYPFLEKSSMHPRCILGMFDVSARPFVPKDSLSFAVPMPKFVQIIENMEESFLITPSWGKVRKRLSNS